MYCIIELHKFKETPVSINSKPNTILENEDEKEKAESLLKDMFEMAQKLRRLMFKSPVKSFPHEKMGYVQSGGENMIEMTFRQLLKCFILNSNSRRCRLEMAMLPVSQ